MMEKTQNIQRETDQIRVDKFPLEMLNAMHNSLVDNQQTLIEEAKQIRISINKSLEFHDGYTIQELRAELKRIVKQERGIQEEMLKISDIRQSKIFRQRLIEKLGGVGWVRLKETIMMILNCMCPMFNGI